MDVKWNKANLNDLIAATGLVIILLKIDSNHCFSSSYDLEIRWMTSKNHRAPVPLLRILSANQYELAFVAHRTAPYWFELTLLRISSCKFLLVPIVFSSHHSAIVLIHHHHRTDSYCIVSPSCCILLHLTAYYQFVFNSFGLIRK